MEQQDAPPPPRPPPPATAPKRSFTMPPSLQKHVAAGQKDDVETLYAHAETKTFRFVATANVGWGTKKHAGTLPWSVPSEQILATGPLALYRLKSSGNAGFLVTGDTIVVLLQRAQWWCVDGTARFAFCVRQHVYRIELPAYTEEERALVEDFKAVLAAVVYYERAPCPFKRGFEQEDTEELPSPASRRRRGPSKKARKWEYNARWRPEDDPNYDPTRRPESSGSPADSEDSVSDATEGSTIENEHEDEEENDDERELAGASIHVQKTRPGVAAVRSMFDQPHAAAPKRSTSSINRGLDTSRHVRSLSQQLEPSSINPKPIPSSSQPPSHARDDSVATVTPATFNRPQTPPSDIPYSTTTPDWAQGQADPLTPPASGSALEKTSVQDTAEIFSVDSHSPQQLLSASASGSEKASEQENASVSTVDLQSLDQVPSADDSKVKAETLWKPDLVSVSEAQVVEDAIPHHDSSAADDSKPAEADSMRDTMSSAASTASIETIPEDSELVHDTALASIHPASIAPPVTPKRENVRRRRTASPRSHRRFRSQDMPSYVLDDMSSPTAPVSRSTSLAALRTSSALITKTMALMMGPPSGLVQVMVQIAARISQSGADGAVFSVRSMTKMMRGHGRAIPGRWTSDSEDEDDKQDGTNNDDELWGEGPNELDEDDFGVPLGVQTPARTRRQEWSSGVS